jgi:hypothetical protein
MRQLMLRDMWRVHHAADGVLLAPPDGRDAGWIRVRACVRPMPRAEELVARARAALPADATVEVGAPLRTTTNEGEYALLVRVIARHGDAETQRTIGMILGDDFCATVEGVTTRPERFEQFRDTVERLVNDYPLGLGPKRRRRYFYTPPPGWAGVTDVHAAVWLSPGFPNHHGILTVFDARPAELTAPLRQERLLYEDLPRDFTRLRRGELPFSSKFNLSGGIEVATGHNPGQPIVVVHDATLRDAHHVYFIRLETDEAHVEANRRAFLDLLQTVEPLPTGDPTAPGHWID